ncbi:hypothetical protein UlMin_025816, partial [Ulmus minor]
DRKKPDGSMLFDTGIHENMDNAATPLCETFCEYLQPEPKYNVRKSLAWDDAFFTSPGVLEPEELFRTSKSRFRDEIIGLEEEILLPSGYLEPELLSRVDRCNLRQSIAWDHAFFTNAGLLDPEELSIVNKGFKNYDTHLPGIEQDVSRSTESNYSLDSGTSSLTSLEMDLFEDMKASRPNSANTPSSSSSSLKLQRGKASKKLEASSQTRMKNTPPLRRLTIDSHANERCTKKASRSVPSQKQLSAGSGELNSSSSHKPPKTLNKVKQTAKVSTKRASPGANSLKVGTPIAASGKCLTIPKKPSLGKSLSLTNSTTLSPKPSSSGFPTAITELVSRSQNNSGSTFQTPSRCTTKDKSKQESTSHPGIMLSTPMPSSCTSLGSSLDGWSSESSSTSVIQRSCNLRESLGTTCRHVSFENSASQESAPRSHLHNLSSAGQGNRETMHLDHHGRKISLVTRSLPSSISKTSKPSGLRMPSPKIGFFDM